MTAPFLTHDFVLHHCINLTMSVFDTSLGSQQTINWNYEGLGQDKSFNAITQSSSVTCYILHVLDTVCLHTVIISHMLRPPCG